MVAVLLSILLIGGTVIGLYCFIETVLLEQNRKFWDMMKHENQESKRSA